MAQNSGGGYHCISPAPILAGLENKEKVWYTNLPQKWYPAWCAFCTDWWQQWVKPWQVPSANDWVASIDRQTLVVNLLIHGINCNLNTEVLGKIIQKSFFSFAFLLSDFIANKKTISHPKRQRLTYHSVVLQNKSVSSIIKSKTLRTAAAMGTKYRKQTLYRLPTDL